MRVRTTLLFCAGVLLVGCGGNTTANMEFVSISPTQPRLGEITTVTFKLSDYRGGALAGAGVKFALQSPKSGVTLGPLEAVSEKGSGLVQTQLVATSRVTSVIVIATSGDKVATSPPISFAGSVPSGRQLTFQCGEIAGTASGGRHAIGAYDEDRNLIAGVKLNCHAHVGDRNGDGVPGALVSFLTEAGTIGPSNTSVADVIGNASILYKTSLPLPVETEPITFNFNVQQLTRDYLVPLWMEPFRWVNNPITQFNVTANRQEPRRADPIRPMRRLNSRDNLVTMIAVTSGEEGFTDINNNGKYDDGEPFDDLGEPFIDNNDNGSWDSDERWIDTDGNTTYTPPDARWNENTLLWAQEKILWTGIPSDLDTRGAEPILRVISPTGPIFVPFLSYYGVDDPDFPGNRIPLAATILLSDPWFNSMAQNDEADGCTIGGEEDKSPVTALPKKAAAGFFFTNPSFRLISFTVKDARDPNAPPAQQIPKRNPAIDFSVPMFCTTTAAKEGGHKVYLGIGSIRGKVE